MLISPEGARVKEIKSAALGRDVLFKRLMGVTEQDHVRRGLKSKLPYSVKSIFYTVKVAVSENHSAAFYIYAVGFLYSIISENEAFVTVATNGKKGDILITDIGLQVGKTVAEEENNFAVGMHIKNSAKSKCLAVRVGNYDTFHMCHPKRDFI